MSKVLVDSYGNEVQINTYVSTDEQVQKAVDRKIEEGVLTFSEAQADAAIDKKVKDGSLNVLATEKAEELEDKVSELSHEIDDINGTLKTVKVVLGARSHGYVTLEGIEGDPTTSKGVHTFNKVAFDCKSGDKFYYTGRLLGSGKVARSAFYKDNTFVGYDVFSTSTPIDYENEEITIPTDINKVVFSGYVGTEAGQFNISIKKAVYKKVLDESEIPKEKISADRFVGHNNLPKCNTDYIQFICYGQSLSNGSDSLYVKDEIVNNCFTLGKIDNPSAELKPLQLTSNLQHPIVSATNSFAMLFHNFVNSKTGFIAGSYGAGGQSIAQLMSTERQAEIKIENNYSYNISTSGRYQLFLNSLIHGKQIASDNKKTISCPAIIFLQGERDYYSDESLSTQAGSVVNAYACDGNKEKYKLYMSRLKDDMQKAVMDTYNQTEKPLFFIYQVSGTFVKNHAMTINMAQIEFAQENDDVILLPSPYFVPNYNSGHLSTNGYRWFGEYIAKALFQTLIMKSEYRPLSFANAKIDSDKNVKVKVCNANLPIQLDNYTVEQSSGYGFAIWADGSRVSPYKVEIFGDEITIYTNTNLTTAKSVEVSYGGVEVNGSGNIRDNSAYKAMYNYWDDSLDKGQSDTLTISHIPTDKNKNSIVGKKYPMYEWLQSFYYKIKD